MQPRACLAASDHHVNYTLYIRRIHFKPPRARRVQACERSTPSSPARKLIHANPAARCDAGWKDGETPWTGPYDVGNMAMHSRFPNSGLGRVSGNLFPLAPPLLCILLSRTYLVNLSLLGSLYSTLWIVFGYQLLCCYWIFTGSKWKI